MSGSKRSPVSGVAWQSTNRGLSAGVSNKAGNEAHLKNPGLFVLPFFSTAQVRVVPEHHGGEMVFEHLGNDLVRVGLWDLPKLAVPKRHNFVSIREITVKSPSTRHHVNTNHMFICKV